MKKSLIFFFFLFLPMEASASVYLNLPLTYPTQQVGKKIPKKQLKQKIGMLGAVLLSIFFLGALIGLIGWLVVGSIGGTFSGLLWWLLGSGIVGILIFFFLASIKAI